jgi:hypothetical protein
MHRIVLLSVVGGPNWQLLPHFLRHYQGLGITHFVIAVNDAKNAAEYHRILTQWNIRAVECFGGFYQRDEPVHRERLHEHLQPDDWVVHADLDELFLYTLPLDELVKECVKEGYQYVGGLCIDHVAPGGSLPTIQPDSPSLWEQFPLMCEATRRLRNRDNSKVVLKHASLPVFSGNHASRIVPSIRRYPEWMQVRWRASGVVGGPVWRCHCRPAKPQADEPGGLIGHARICGRRGPRGPRRPGPHPTR